MSGARWADVAMLAMRLASARNWAVFPCAETKHPTVKDWPNRASVRPNEINQLWAEHGGPLIGVVTGERSGIDVLDFDVKHDEALHWWRVYRERMPPTLAFRTRSGGMHRYFVHAEGVRNTASKICQGIDTRGDGGFVIYWFAAGLACLAQEPLAAWPDWLLEQVLRKPPPAVAAPGARRWADTGPPSTDFAIHGMLRRVANAKEGERNAILNWASWRLGARVLAGELGRAEAESLLAGAAAAAGLDAVEAGRTIASGLKGAGT